MQTKIRGPTQTAYYNLICHFCDQHTHFSQNQPILYEKIKFKICCVPEMACSTLINQDQPLVTDLQVIATALYPVN